MSLNNAGNKVISSVKTNKKNIIIVVDQKPIKVSLDTYAELKLYKGKRLLDDTFKELKRQERLSKDIVYAKNICIKAIRNESDVRHRLTKRNVSIKDIDYIINLLKENKLLDDDIYADALLTHLNRKLYGKLKIYQELKRKNVTKNIEIGKDVEFDKLRKIYPKVYKKYLKSNPEYQARQKTFKYLITRGYLIEDINDIKGENE